jgi:hypothetical protein
MSTNLDLKEIERRANQVIFQDGLTEIVLGTFLVLYGGALTTEAFPWYLIVLAAIFLGKPAIERIKTKYIYPRTGYVKLPPEPKSTGKGIAIVAAASIVGLIALMALSMLIVGRSQGMIIFLTYIVPPVTGILMAIGPLWMVQKYGLLRGYVWAGLFVLSGFAIPLLDIAIGYQAVGLMCLIGGLVILLAGSIIFIRFLRSNQPQTIENQEASNG